MVGLVLIELWLPLSPAYEPVRWSARGAVIILWTVSYRRWQTSPDDDLDQPGASRRAWLEALGATAMIAIFLVTWLATTSEPYEEVGSPLPGSASALLAWIARRFGLAALQQVVLQLFIWRLMRRIVRHEPTAVILAATLFGLFHLPSMALTIATFLGAVVWIGLFHRSRRLAPVIVSHALLAGLASVAVPERLFYEMHAGAVALQPLSTYRQLADPEIRSLLRDLTSATYFAHCGGTTEGYVAGLYHDILGRPATRDEIAEGSTAIESSITNNWPGPSSRAHLAKSLVTSDEAHLHHRSPRQTQLDIRPLPPKVHITADNLLGDDWYGAEQGWRWARGNQPTIFFQQIPAPRRGYLLELSGGARTPQTVTLEIDGQLLGELTFESFEPQTQRLAFDGALLSPTGEVQVRLRIRGDRVSDAEDPRPLGLGLRSLELTPLRFPSVAVTHHDDLYFLSGFSAAEQNLRWSQESSARLAYPLREVESPSYVFELLAGAFGKQRVEIRLNDHDVASWTIDGLTPTHHLIELDATLLRAGVNRIDLQLPDAKNTKSDPRRLGIAFVSARITPAVVAD